VPLDQSRMTNFKNYASPLVTDPSWDPGNIHTMAWQSGYTCIGYNTKYITEDIHSIQSLFDPKYEGKIGMMGIATELGSAGLLAIGVDPAASTPDDWSKAAEKLNQQKPLVRSYYDQDYIKALKNEDIWISMVWSGDVFQAANYQGYDTLKAVIPDEGSMFWTDNQLIPVGVENPVAAMEFMDYVYDPQVQALIEDYNAYVCPVPAAKSIIANQLKDPTVANSPTVFPDAQMLARSKPYYQFKNSQDLDQWNSTFEPIYTG
jgi:spermidine/putrescine transport system substrate-binding protein